MKREDRGAKEKAWRECVDRVTVIVMRVMKLPKDKAYRIAKRAVVR